LVIDFFFNSNYPSLPSSAGGLFKPFGALSLSGNGHTSLSNPSEIDSILHGNGLGSGVRAASLQSTTNLGQSHFVGKTSEAESRRLLLANGSQMQMYASGAANGHYPQQASSARALSSSSSSSMQQADALKENHDM
jgi:hypothetical protein